MRRLFLNTTILLSILLVVNIALLRWTSSRMDRVKFLLPQGVNTLILGNSQMECGLNDSILDHSVNMAQAGEAYLYSFAKARRFIDQDPGLDTIWLSYSFGSLEKVQDTLTHSERYIKYKLPYNFFMLDREDMRVFLGRVQAYAVLLRTPYLRRHFLARSMRGNITVEDLHIGCYLKLVRDKLAIDVSARDSLRRAGAVRPPEFGSAMDQTTYLTKLIDLCRERKVTCILVNPPIHPVITATSDTAAYYAYWRNHMGDVPLWDHSQWTFPDSCFGDATHLNYKGALAYSARLQELRSKGWPATDPLGRVVTGTDSSTATTALH